MTTRTSRVLIFILILAVCLIFAGCATYQPHPKYSQIKDPLIKNAVAGCRARAIYHGTDDNTCMKKVALDLLKKYQDMYNKGFKAGKAGGRCEMQVKQG